MRALITGGAGFIGLQILEETLKRGYKVTIFDNFSRGTAKKNKIYIQKKYSDVKIIRADIRDYKAVKDAVRGKDVIYHCAGQTAVTTSLVNPLLDKQINVDGTFNILEATRKQKNKPIIIFCSTNKVYGNNVNKIPLEELEKRYDFANEFKGRGVHEAFSIDAREHTPYGCSKLTADLYIQDYNKIYGIPTAINRMSCIYGINQYGTEDQAWVSHFVISSILNKILTIYGDGKQVRDILFGTDLAKLFVQETENIEEIKGEVFNIGGGPKNTISLLELLNEIRDLKLNHKISFSSWRPADQKVYYSDISKVKKLLGWEPKISPKKGIKLLYEWAKEAVI